MFKKISTVLTLLFIIAGSLNVTLAQEAEKTSVDMADSLRADGKIYVVVLVVMIVFTFFSMYLLLTDRHVKKWEKEMKEMKESKK